MRLVIADTGPLNYLILRGKIQVLPQLFGTVTIPTSVHAELADPDAPPEVAPDAAIALPVLYISYSMRFEWHEEKNRANQQKHGGIAFESAALVFNVPNAVFRQDRVIDGEQRWHAIGAGNDAVLLVVHVCRRENDYGEEETIRLISAREANQRERRIYLQQATE